MRMNVKKRPQDLIRAIPEIQHRLGPERPVRFTLVGDGPYRPNVERLVDRLNLRDTVTLAGRMSRPQIQEVFRQTDLFVLPTVLEAFGIAVLEARCAGLPSVVIRSSGAAELVRDGQQGRHARNRRELAPVIAELLADPLGRERMGRQAREGVDEFAWPQVIQRHLDFYDRAREKVGRIAKRPVVLPAPCSTGNAAA